MPFDPSLFTEKLRHRDYDFLIPKKNISEIIFNGDEIILVMIKVQKSEITDFTSLIISAMGTSGLDEWEMQNCSIIATNEKLMLQKTDDFQIYWKLDLAIETYLEGDLQYLYEVDTDPSKKGHGSEMCYAIETTTSFIYFYTSHFYY